MALLNNKLILLLALFLGTVWASNAGTEASNRRRRRLPGGKLEASDFDCPEDFGYYPHHSECSKYYVCVFGGALLESCTGGLLYSDELQTCDWPRNVKCDRDPAAPENQSSQFTTVRITDPRTSSPTASSPGPSETDVFTTDSHSPFDVQEQIDFNSVGGIDKQNLDKFALVDQAEFDHAEEFSAAADGEASPTKTRFLRKSDPAPQSQAFENVRRPAFGRNAQQFVTPNREPVQQQRSQQQQQQNNRQQFSQPSPQRASQEFLFPEYPDNLRPNQQLFAPTSGVDIRNQGSAGQRFPTLFDTTPVTRFTSPSPAAKQPTPVPQANHHSAVRQQQQELFSTAAPFQPTRLFRNEQPSSTTPPPPPPSTTPKLNNAQSLDYYNYTDGDPVYVYDYYEYDVAGNPNSPSTAAPETERPRFGNPNSASTAAPPTERPRFGNPPAADFGHFQTTTTTATTSTTTSKPFVQHSNIFGSRFNNNDNDFNNNNNHQQQQPQQIVEPPQQLDSFPNRFNTATNGREPALNDNSDQESPALDNKRPLVPGRGGGSSSLFVRDRTRTRAEWNEEHQSNSDNNHGSFADNTVVSSTTSRPAPVRTPAPGSRGSRRPTLKPASKVVPSKITSIPIDIWNSVPQRPPPVYPQPPYNEIASKCSADTCILPDCYCGGKTVPGGYEPQDIPQVVLLTFDDAVNDLNKELYQDLFEKGRVNPNGCPIQATFYVSHEWTDYSQVQNLYADGHEIASHTISHSFGENFSEKRWAEEVEGQRDVMAAYAGVKREDVRGMRAPFLQIGGNKMFKMLYDRNFTYDSSMPVYENKPPSFPYTLDYKIFHDCMIPPCPTKSYPGVWEVPMVMWQDLKGGRCSMVDGCSAPADAEGIYKMLIKNFERHYTTNRAPVGLFFHAAWFTNAHHKEGFIAFLDTISAMDDVWLVTNWQSIQWMRDPTPLSHVKNFKPFGCHYPERPSRCNRAQVCNVWHKTGVRYMKSCQTCPEKYPWTGKAGVPQNPTES